MKHYIAILFVLFASIFGADPAFAAECSEQVQTGCDEVKRQTGRDTSGGKIATFANHCDVTLRRIDEAVSFQVTPAGHKAYSTAAKKLPGLSWASRSKAGNRFEKYGIQASDGRTVVETELCAGSKVWANALAKVGVTPDDVISGKTIVWLCGEDFAHEIPIKRLVFLKGRKSKGFYSVLSKDDTKFANRELTKRGH